MSGRGRRIAVMALLVIVAGAAWWALSGRVRRSSDVRAAEVPATERLAILDNSLRAIADADRDAPRDRWDPDYVVQQVGRNPDSLAAWVREHTAWVPYRGTLRGPLGVLMDRRGNALDRALLLAELLTRAGHAPRLGRAELTEAQADALLPVSLTASLAAQRDDSPEDAPADGPVADIAATYGLDAPSVERTLEAQQEATTLLLTDLEQRTADHAARLLDVVPGPLPIEEWAGRWVSALDALRDHWWVRVQDGSTWRDLDLAPRDSTMASLAPSETVDPDEIAPTLRHEVIVRVVAERLTHGALAESHVLEHALRPADVIGQPVALQLWPAAWPSTGLSSADSGRSFRRAALQQEEWHASLMVGDRGVAQAQLVASEVPAQPAVSGGLGGLGGAIAGAMKPRPPSGSADDGVLTAVWLEYEVRAPGRPARVIRRPVFDLVGPANRQGSRFDAVSVPSDSLRLARSLAMMMRTDILLLGAHPAPEFIIHAFARSAAASAGLLRAIAEPGFTSEPQRADSLLGTALPGVDPLHTFAMLRQEVLGDLGFLDRPAVFTRHRFPAVLGAGVGTSDAFDLVANEIGISLAEPDGFAARMAQGVWDTNLEAILGGTEGNVAAAFSRQGGWEVVESPSGLARTALGANARALLARELERGAVAVAPDAAAAGAGSATGAWWRIDAATGDALGIGPLGWGQGVDYGTHLRATWEMSKALVYAYAQCQAIPQAANALNILGAEFWRLGLAPKWVKRRSPDPNIPEFSLDNPKAFRKDVGTFFRGEGTNLNDADNQPPVSPGKDFEEVAAENHRKCVLDAIRSGFLATAPILLMQLRAMRLRSDGAGLRYTRMAASARGASRAGRRPAAGWRPRPYTGRRGPRGGRGSPEAPPATTPSPPPVPSTPPARTPHRQDPRPHDPGKAPPGKGPFRGDPEQRQWHRENWHPDPTQAHPATRAMGSPEIYDNADRAAIERYNSARESGLDDAAARQQSYEEWWRSTQAQRRARGVYQIPGGFGDAWSEWVPDRPIGSAPPSGTPPPSAGATIPGSPMASTVGDPAPTGGSPTATSTGPGPAATTVSDARMAVGLAGLTGGDD